MNTVTVEKPKWDQAWIKAKNTLKVKDTQAKHEFGMGAIPVIERMTRAAEDILEQTRQTLETE